MAVKRNRWLHVSRRQVRVLVCAGIMSGSAGASLLQADAQSEALRPVCVGITPSEHQQRQRKTLQNQCCQRRIRAQCIQWQEIFPAAVPAQPPSFKRPAPADSFSPKIDAFGNSVGSEGAAKDAVIQVGITKALNAVAPTFAKAEPNPKADHRPNFFQRLRNEYQRILGPRELKSGAILTPQLGMDMDVGRFNVNAMKVGVEIKF
jgi:hypothetical protein